jgi:hypothetical protein
VGDRPIVRVSANVNRLIPSTSGNRKDTPVLPPMFGMDPWVTRIAAIPV